MDKLDHIFTLQEQFDQELIQRRQLTNWDAAEWVQHQVLAMVAELAELLAEVNFKWWKNPEPLNEVAIREELVDILHFFIGMCLQMGISAEDLYQAYLTKNKENLARQNGASERKGYDILG